MSIRRRQLVKLFARILITAGLLIWVFSRIDLGQFRHAVKTARWQFLVAVWGLVVAIFWINSIKMRLILKKQSCDVSVPILFGASAVTLLYGMIMPGLLSTGIKWYILKKNTGRPGNVLSSMLYNQLSIMVVMMVFGLVALMITNPAPLLIANAKNQWLLPVACGIFLVPIICTSLLLLNRRTGGRAIEVFKLLLSPFPNKIRQKGQDLLGQVTVFQTVSIRFHVTIASLTIVANIIGGVFMYILAAKAANVTVPPGIFIWLAALIYLLGRVPISVANLGVREVTLVGFLAAYGVETSAALLMSVTLFSASVFMALIGAIYQLSWALSARKSAEQGEQASSVKSKSEPEAEGMSAE